MAKALDLIGDAVISGNLKVGSMDAPANFLDSDSQIAASQNLDPTKFKWPIRIYENFGKEFDAVATAVTYPVYQAEKAGTWSLIFASCYTDPTGGAPANEVNFDLLKNGSTVLSAKIDVEETTGDRVRVYGTFSDTAIAAGDFFTADITLTGSGGTQGKGPLLVVVGTENSA